MSRSSSERVSKDEELLKEKILKEIDFLSDHWVNGDDKIPFNFGGWRDEVAFTLVEICNWYADQKIKQMMFDEQAIKGLIRVKTENGTLWLTPEEFEEYKKTLEGALLREVK